MCKINHNMRRGFTLVEILMVVVILGIAGAIIVPQLGSRDDLKAAAAARMLLADLIYAQNMAITRQTNHYVKFEGQQYKLLVAPGMTLIRHPVNKNDYLARFGTGGTQGLRDVSLVSASFVGQVSPTAYATIGFDPLGTPVVYPDADPADTMSSGSIVLQSGQYKLRIDVEPFTGETKVTPVN